MRSTVLSIGLLIPLSLVACDKDDSQGAAASSSASPSASTAAAAPTASATPAPAASAVASSGPLAPKCPAGLAGNAVPAYCIKLPAGYKVKDARTADTRGSIAYDTGTTTDNLMVSYEDTPLASEVKDVEGEMQFGGGKIEKKGDLPGGNKWFQGSHADYERLVTLIKGQPPLTLKCSFAYKPSSPPPKDAIDACKSIVVP
jgi:hypothetical protein